MCVVDIVIAIEMMTYCMLKRDGITQTEYTLSSLPSS